MALKLISDAAQLNVAEQTLLAEIERCIKKPPRTTRVFYITPAVAFVLLERYNHENRARKPVKIKEYATDMATQQWALTGDTIKFSNRGLLRDGQNRLTACWQSRSTFCTHVVFGIPDEYFDRMDHGRNRDGGDLLAIAKFKNTKQLAVAARWVYLIDQGRVKRRDVVSPRETLRLATQEYPTLHEYCVQGRRIYDNTRQPSGMVTGLLYAFARKNPDAAEKFATAWAAGSWGGVFKPIGLMQEVLMSMREISDGRVHEVVRAAYIVTAWNLYRAHRKGRKVDFNYSVATEEFPTIE